MKFFTLEMNDFTADKAQRTWKQDINDYLDEFMAGNFEKADSLYAEGQRKYKLEKKLQRK